MSKLPYGEPPAESQALKYLTVEISYGSRWINLNDGHNYRIAAEQTRENTAKTWRKVMAQSPVLGGNYLVHAVPEMVTETIGVRVYGQDQTDLADNFYQVQALFEQFDYRIRWTTNEYREYWRCQLADSSLTRSQVLTHNQIALCSFTVPRYPDVTRERIE